MDIRVRNRGDLQLDDLRGIGADIKDRYPTSKETFKITGTVAIGAENSHQEMKQEKAGFQFTTGSNDRLFNAQIDGWSFSKFPPYESWGEFQKEGRELWQRYRGIAKPLQITRVAVRYVNKLELPLPFDDFNKYLKTIPVVGENLPQGLSSFFMQLQIPHENLHAMLLLNQALVSPSREGVASIVLDLDIFRDHDVPQDEEAIWAYFEELRAAKNNAFEASITDATRGLFA